MRLNANTLIAVAKKMVDLEKIDVVVGSFVLHGHTFHVETTDTQMEGREYFLVGVDNYKDHVIQYPTGVRQGRPIKDNPQA